MPIILRNLFRSTLVVIAFLSSAAIVGAQPRDYLTDPESELIRFHQQLDKRIEVFIRAIDRRFAIINGGEQVKTKRIEKGEPEWGDLPKGSRAELLRDVVGILDAAISNIDDVSQHDEKSPLISRSLRKLTAATNIYVTQLNTLASQTKDPDEIAAIEHALENARQIIEAGSKLPPPSTEKSKKDKP